MLVSVLTDVEVFSLSTTTVNSVVSLPLSAVFSTGYNFNFERFYFAFSISPSRFLSVVTPLGVISDTTYGPSHANENFPPFLSFLLLLHSMIRSLTLISLLERWRRSKSFFSLSWAFLMLLVADSWISPRIRMADARIDSNVLSSKPSVSLSSLSAKRNLMSIGKTGSLL